MKRTFKGFLKAYCAELSGLETTSLIKLSNAAQDNARLVEPLFCLAAVQGKADYLVRISKGTWYCNDYLKLAEALAISESVEELLQNKNTPARYRAVFKAYLAQWDLLSAGHRMNRLLRPKILERLGQGELSRYQLCKSLNLNMGNVYAYLAGDDAKVSRETAERIWSYVQSHA